VDEFKRLLRRLGELTGAGHAAQAPRATVPGLPGVRRKPSGPSALDRPRKKARRRQLHAHDLPFIPHREALAELLDLPLPKLYWLTHGRNHYVAREIPKRSGGTRTLHAPKQTLKWVQRWILDHILSKVPVADQAQGFVPGRSICSHATQHTGRRVVVNCDLVDFFPSITASAVYGLFQWMGYGRKMSWVFALLCTVEHEGQRILPQGAPTSPALTNLICWRLDRRLAGLARAFGFTYSRYADDLTFSGDAAQRVRVRALLDQVRQIAAAEGFALNDSKLCHACRGSRQLVTGLVVNDKVAVPRARVRRLRAILHNCARDGAASQNRTGDPLFLQRLAGEIAFVSQVDPTRAAPLRAAFAALPEAGGA